MLQWTWYINLFQNLRMMKCGRPSMSATKECNSFGLTSVQEMELNLRQFNLYQKLIDEDIFPLRVYSCIDGPGETWDYFKQHRMIRDYGNRS